MPSHTWAPATFPMHHKGAGEIIIGGAADGRDVIALDLDLVQQGFDLIDVATGRIVPCQVSYITDTCDPRPWSAERIAKDRQHGRYPFEIVFLAEDMPAFGYRTYKLA